jgi:transposase
MKRCRENIVMKALAEDTELHYSTISDFIKEKGEAVKNVFQEVLLVCDELKLIEGSTFWINLSLMKKRTAIVVQRGRS